MPPPLPLLPALRHLASAGGVAGQVNVVFGFEIAQLGAGELEEHCHVRHVEHLERRLWIPADLQIGLPETGDELGAMLSFTLARPLG